MKFFVSILLTALLAFASGFYLPWWSVAVASFVIAILIYQKPWISFLTGFMGVLLLWPILIWKINAANENVLAPKISLLMGFGEGNVLLIVVTCAIGAIVGGLGALTGSLLRKVLKPNLMPHHKPNRDVYYKPGE
jgi:hypothetical protein